MGKFLKVIFGVLFLVVGLVIVAAIVLPLVIDPNDYKDEITRKVAEQTGRTLAIEGDIDLSVFPWLGLDIGPTQFSNAPGFGDQPMARMEAVQVRVKLLPLLRKQLEMDTVKLAGLQLNLAKDAQGRTNWSDLQGEAPTEEPAAGAEDGEPSGAILEGLAIGGIEVSDARLVWDDRSSDARYEINDLAFTTGAIRTGEAFDLDLHFGITAGEPAMNGAFDLSGGVLVGESLQTVTVSKAGLDLDLQGDGVPGGQMKVSLATDVALDLEKQTLTLPELLVKLAGLTITGNVAGTAITGDDPRFAGSFRIAEFVPRDVIKALGQEPPQTADGSVLGKADALLEWEASTRHAAATTLQLRFDDTTLKGQASVKQFDAPAIAFSLQADTIDLDRYLPPVAEAPDTQAQPAAESADEAGELPLDALRSLNLDGSVKVGSLKAYNLRSSDVNVRIKAKDGLLRINPAGARMYDGQYRGDITLDARRDTPRIALDEHVTGVQAGPLLKDLTGDDKLLGTAEVHAKLTGAGADPVQIRKTLNGNVSFSFLEGAVKGVNIASLIRNAQAKFKGQPVPADDQPNQTDFAELRGSAAVTNGLVKNDDLSLKSPLLRITGAGTVSLPEESIDYLLTTKIVGSLEGQGGAALGELKGIAVPVRIGGTFSKPTYKPDVSAALSEAAKAKVEEKVEEKKEELQEKLEEKLQDELGDKLKGLFK